MSAPVFDSPQACEEAFYDAFSRCDLEAMMGVWATAAPLLCIHPGGVALTRRDTIARSWAGIFEGGGGVRFSLTDRRCVVSDDVAVRFVHENIHHGPGLRSMAVVCATNVYLREGESWRMCTHHASPGSVPVPRADDAVH